MASILLLNDDCLYMIVSCLDDPGSFRSFALTCKRFQQATKIRSNVLYPSLLRKKAAYYIKRYMVDICGPQKRGLERYRRLSKLLQEAVWLTLTKGLLSYAAVVDVWQRKGPVAAELFTWIRKQESIVQNGQPRTTCITKHRSVTLHLPACKRRMVIKTSNVHDYGHNDNDELSIRVICGDLDVKSEGFVRRSPKDSTYWSKKELSNDVEQMKPVLELLQNELGDTVPLITGHFLIWLKYFFPDKRTVIKENKLYFKESRRNTKPSSDAVQSAMDLFRQDQEVEAKFQSVVSEWKNKEEQGPMYSKTVVETIDLLVRRSETRVLKRLQGVAARSYFIASDYHLQLLPKQLLLDLFLRTTLKTSNYSPHSIADNYVKSSVLFKCLESKAMKVSGAMHGGGASYPSWYELDLEFNLPDGRELKMGTGTVIYGDKIRPMAIGHLSPVTELLQQGINQRMQSEKHIPKINNLFTAVYFVHALQFSEATDTFLGNFRYEELFQMESDEY